MKRNTLKNCIVVASLLVLFLSSPVLAGGWSTPVDVITSTQQTKLNLEKTEGSINSQINGMRQSIVDTLTRHGAQLSGYIAEGSRSTATAIDSQTKLQAQTAREIEEVKAVQTYKPNIQACQFVTGAAGLGGSSEKASYAATIFSENEEARLSSNAKSLTNPGTTSDTSERFDRIFSSYCNAEQSFDESGVCTGSPEFHNADINAATLFSSDILETVEKRQAAQDLIENLVAPTISNPPAIASADTDMEQEQVLKHRSRQSRTTSCQ